MRVLFIAIREQDMPPRQYHREEQAELDDSEERLRAVFPAAVRLRLKHADQSRALFAIR